VEESEAPESNGRAGRIAWSSKTPEGLEIYHAWLVEDLEGQRVRILTQESQIGPIFKEWEEQKPNKMCKHQDGTIVCGACADLMSSIGPPRLARRIDYSC
jgi:hypothetical protein